MNASKGAARGTAKDKGRLAVLLAASMMNLMGGAAVAPALPQMSAAFPDASATEVTLVITLPALAIAIVGLAVGALADRVGKVRTLALSSLVFTAAGLSGAVLGSIEAILAGRFLLGIGIAGITVSTTALISECYDGAARSRVLALQSASMGAGILLLEFGGGVLAEFGWRMPFLVYLVGVVIFVGVLLFLREDGGGKERGETAGDRAEAPGGAEGASGRSAGGAPVFRRGDVLAAVVGGALAIFLLEVLSFAFPGKLPYFIEELGATSSTSGLFLGIHGSCMAAASLLQGRLAPRTRRSTLLVTGFALLAACFAAFFALPSLPAVLVAACVGGAGIGIVMPTVLQWVSSVMTPETSGKIMGCYTVMLNLGQFACSLVLAPVMLAVGSTGALFGVFACFAEACCVAIVLARRGVDGSAAEGFLSEDGLPGAENPGQ
ncbi:MFS transporter [Gordonibacter massiliensis (ex Traore et al. 2017)]|uniref:MFS transporter n=1 Tax=Gordonibacter massiliensis (ex Traore et al. 2017) TaxID=1841863 RepID=A0A842JFF4_9ACTN|nr:MFS transporter [Gordonibacter massiliensis (ex Traore et al. 2017)]